MRCAVRGHLVKVPAKKAASSISKLSSIEKRLGNLRKFSEELRVIVSNLTLQVPVVSKSNKFIHWVSRYTAQTTYSV